MKNEEPKLKLAAMKEVVKVSKLVAAAWKERVAKKQEVLSSFQSMISDMDEALRDGVGEDITKVRPFSRDCFIILTSCAELSAEVY